MFKRGIDAISMVLGVKLFSCFFMGIFAVHNL
jgi:hypothetical protein